MIIYHMVFLYDHNILQRIIRKNLDITPTRTKQTSYFTNTNLWTVSGYEWVGNVGIRKNKELGQLYQMPDNNRESRRKASGENKEL